MTIEFFYEKLIIIKNGEEFKIIQKDPLNKSQAGSRRKTPNLPAKVFERIHIHPEDKKLRCTVRDLIP